MAGAHAADPLPRRALALLAAPFILLARACRRWCDTVDPGGAVRFTHVSFTFEDGLGMVFRDDGRGCRVAYLGAAEYERAHAEAGRPVRAGQAWLPYPLASRTYGQKWPPRGYSPPARQLPRPGGQ